MRLFLLEAWAGSNGRFLTRCIIILLGYDQASSGSSCCVVCPPLCRTREKNPILNLLAVHLRHLSLLSRCIRRGGWKLFWYLEFILPPFLPWCELLLPDTPRAGNPRPKEKRIRRQHTKSMGGPIMHAGGRGSAVMDKGNQRIPITREITLLSRRGGNKNPKLHSTKKSLTSFLARNGHPRVFGGEVETLVETHNQPVSKQGGGFGPYNNLRRSPKFKEESRTNRSPCTQRNTATTPARISKGIAAAAEKRLFWAVSAEFFEQCGSEMGGRGRGVLRRRHPVMHYSGVEEMEGTEELKNSPTYHLRNEIEEVSCPKKQCLKKAKMHLINGRFPLGFIPAGALVSSSDAAQPP